MKKYVFTIFLVCFAIQVVWSQERKEFRSIEKKRQNLRSYKGKSSTKILSKGRRMRYPIDTIQIGGTVTFDVFWDAKVFDSVVISPRFYKLRKKDLKRGKYSFFIVPQLTIKITTLIYHPRLPIQVGQKIVVLNKEGEEMKRDANEDLRQIRQQVLE